MGTKTGKWRPPGIRTNERLKGTNLALLRRAGLGPQLATMGQLTRGRMLRALRVMSMLFAVSPAQRAQRIAWLAKELPKLFPKLGIDPADLGAGGVAALCRTFIRMMRRVELRKTYASLAELKQKAGGFRSTPMGELFELLGDNLRDLRALRRSFRKDAIDELNHLLKHAPHLLRNGLGAAIGYQGTFTRVIALRDVKIKLKGIKEPKKFVDRASLSPLDPAAGQTPKLSYYGLLEAVELKLREAAKRELAKQSGEAEPRIESSRAEWIEGVDEATGARIVLAPDQLVYSPVVRRIGVTHPEAGATPVVEWRKSRAAKGDLYLHYEADIKVEPIRALIALLFPLGSKMR